MGTTTAPDRPGTRARRRFIAASAGSVAGLLALVVAPVGAVDTPPSTSRVSVTSAGSESEFGGSTASISADGRFVTFTSTSADLVAGDTNDSNDVFLHDRKTGATTRVSVASDGTEANGGSEGGRISGNGRFIAFSSFASNLVPDDENGNYDAFVHDRALGTTERVSVATGGAEGNDRSDGVSISFDGSIVAFASTSSNLSPGDTGTYKDVFVRDRVAGTTERITSDPEGDEGDEHSGEPSVSSDGKFVAFQSVAGNLVTGDTNDVNDVFIHDLASDATERVSVATGGADGDMESRFPSVSADGRFVAFDSRATNFVALDENDTYDIFVRDRNTSMTERVSVSTAGAEGDGPSFRPSISGDGRFVALMSRSATLVAGDSNGFDDVFVRDRMTMTTERVSIATGGAEGNEVSNFPQISAGGRFVAFASEASNLVAGDANEGRDVFVRDRGGIDPDCLTGFSDVPIAHPFCEDIAWLVDREVTTGYPDGTYRPGTPIARQAMAAFLYRYEGEPAFVSPAIPTFSDVPATHPFYAEIEWAAETGVAGGFDDGTFRPTVQISRQAMAAFLYRVAGEPAFTPPGTPTFPDVPTDHPFSAEIEWVAARDITTGFDDGSFRPGSPVTRQAVAAFLHRLDDLQL